MSVPYHYVRMDYHKERDMGKPSGSTTIGRQETPNALRQRMGMIPVRCDGRMLKRIGPPIQFTAVQKSTVVTWTTSHLLMYHMLQHGKSDQGMKTVLCSNWIMVKIQCECREDFPPARTLAAPKHEKNDDWILTSRNTFESDNAHSTKICDRMLSGSASPENGTNHIKEISLIHQSFRCRQGPAGWFKATNATNKEPESSRASFSFQKDGTLEEKPVKWSTIKQIAEEIRRLNDGSKLSPDSVWSELCSLKIFVLSSSRIMSHSFASCLIFHLFPFLNAHLPDSTDSRTVFDGLVDWPCKVRHRVRTQRHRDQ